MMPPITMEGFETSSWRHIFYDPWFGMLFWEPFGYPGVCQIATKEMRVLKARGRAGQRLD